MIVDDNPSDTLLLEKALNKFDVQAIETIRTATQAIDRIQDIFLENKPLPDLIFAGFSLHVFAGFSEMILWLKENPILKRIPIIALSGVHNPKERTKALAIGVDEYHEKPLGRDLTTLVRCIVGTYL